MWAPILPWQCRYSKVKRDIFLWGNLIHSATTAPGPLTDLSPRERSAPPDTLDVSHLNQTLFVLFSFHHSFGLEAKIETNHSWKTSNSIDAYLFVEHSCTLELSMLFRLSSFCGFVQFHLFSFLWLCACVCLEQCYIWEWTACLDGLGWHFRIVLVPWCLPVWMGAHLYMSLMP